MRPAMIASLMMYARPELDGALGRYWALIREGLRARGLQAPERLSNEVPPFDVWQSPDLVLSQTCGMPYRTLLQDKVQLVGTPDYGLEDCPPGYYRSAIVVRADDPRDRLEAYRDARFAYNESLSQSGFAAAYQVAQAAGFWFADRVQSHGHRNSAIAIAEGLADIATLDAMTWRLIRRHDGFADKLRVLGWTGPTPGLPYITAGTTDPAPVAAAVRAAIAALEEADRAALCLRGLVAIPGQEYLAIPNPPPEAG